MYPTRILLWAAVSEMSRREGIWRRDDDRRQSLRRGKQRQSRVEGIPKENPDAREPVLTRVTILSSSGRADMLGSRPQFMIHEGEGKPVKDYAPPWENECSGLKKEMEARQRPCPSVPEARRKASFLRLTRYGLKTKKKMSPALLREKKNLGTVLGSPGNNWLHPWF